MVGINSAQPDENFFYIDVQEINMYNLLHITGTDPTKVTGYELLNQFKLQQVTMSYSADGLDCDVQPDQICEVLKEITIPEGFYVNAKVKFLGANATLKVGMDSSFMELQLNMDPINIGGMIELRQTKSGPMAKKGMFVKAYLGWTPSTIFGNGDWCHQTFCMYGAGYAKIPLLAMEGWYSFEASFGTNGVKYGYELVGVPMFGGLLTADANFAVEGTGDKQVIEAGFKIQTNDIFLKVAHAAFKILKIIYDGIMAGIEFVKPLLETAEEFINTAIGPMKVVLKTASSGIKSVYNTLISPFKSLADKAKGIEGCHPVKLLEMPEFDQKNRVDYLILMDEYDAGTMIPKDHPDYVAPAPQNHEQTSQLDAILMERSQATNFLSVKERAEFGFVSRICESATEAAKKVAEALRKAALWAACQVALAPVNIAYVALMPVRALWLLVDLMHDNLEHLNPASIVIKMLDFLQKQVDAIFGTLKKGMESGKVEEFAEALNYIFSLQELSGNMKLSPDQTVLGVALICKVFGKVIDFKLEFKLKPGAG